MYKTLHTIEELYRWIDEDKKWTGAESAMRNRYPLRFVLFENFGDFNAFADKCSNHKLFVGSMEKWMKEGVDDSMLTYSKLAKRFKEYVAKIRSDDFVIAPFSEITRFYDNSEENAEFDSLVKTIRLIEASEEGQKSHQRVYVPIVGMQSKMDKFKNDPNIIIWEYCSEQTSPNYQLVLTNGSFYGVQGLEQKHTLCHNLREWIALWQKGGAVKQRIMCCSKALFNNAHYAQPDNAFGYIHCPNAFIFLRDGLGINFGDIVAKEEEMQYWERLAKDVDVTDFSFSDYVANKFNVVTLDELESFLHAWCENYDSYSRWLLKTFYIIRHSEDNYLKRVLQKTPTMGTSDFFSTVATLIFDEQQNEASLNQRLIALRVGMKAGVSLTDMAERIIDTKLKAIALDPERGYYTAMKYMSPISTSEKRLMIRWLGEGAITRGNVKHLYPKLYEYTNPLSLSFVDSKAWVNDYFTEYCKSKMANSATSEFSAIIAEKNASPVTFETWRDQFKTVKTLLHGREDIDVYYWIDGMGVDWIPFVTSIIKKHEVDNVYLNEVHVATTGLPTRTSNNKIKLQELCGDKLQKIGDIDTFAHKTKKYPDYIEEELGEMEKAIKEVLRQYNGKKIAFVSDHGITYMACHEGGMNIAGIKGDHAGRCGEWEQGNATADNNYIILEDGKTVCALTHRSLTSKVPEVQGAHGGATPEEVLVPIIIVSNQKNGSNYSIALVDNVVTSSAPIVKYTIKGLNSIDIPVVEYNDVDYTLTKKSENVYESERLNLVDTATKITVKIGSYKHVDELTIKTGVEESDLFDDL